MFVFSSLIELIHLHFRRTTRGSAHSVGSPGSPFGTSNSADEPAGVSSRNASPQPYSKFGKQPTTSTTVDTKVSKTNTIQSRKWRIDDDNSACVPVFVYVCLCVDDYDDSWVWQITVKMCVVWYYLCIQRSPLRHDMVCTLLI